LALNSASVRSSSTAGSGASDTCTVSKKFSTLIEPMASSPAGMSITGLACAGAGCATTIGALGQNS
jgi:hypothetical protein